MCWTSGFWVTAPKLVASDDASNWRVLMYWDSNFQLCLTGSFWVPQERGLWWWELWSKKNQRVVDSVVPAWLGLKAVSKAWLFMALAFQNWSLSCAYRLGPAQAWPRLRPQPVGNLSGDFYAQKKKKIKSPVLNDNNAIIFIYAYLTHFHTFIWI